MPENPAFTIRSLKITDLDQALGLSRAEGWNQTDKDWKLLLDNRQNICIAAVKEGKLAGTATALNHDNRIAWIGMVIVDKSLRGMGAGKMLLEHLINKLKEIESIKLDATPAGEPLYRKLGFIPEYKVFRMRHDAEDFYFDQSMARNVTSINREMFREIVNFDKSVFGADRSYLLNNLLINYPDKALCMLNNRRIEGYLFGRDGFRFTYMGPLIAQSEDVAECLITKTLESITDQPVGVDVPEYQEGLIRWLESIGFVIQREFVRMYLNTNPFHGQLKNQFLISGPEFG